MTNKEKTELQKKIISEIKSKPHGRFLLPPRSGKTKIMIDIIKRENPKSILWATPSVKLAKEDIPKEFEIWNAKDYIDRLTTVTYASLRKTEGYFEMIILDEDQSVSELNMSNLLNKKLTYSYICSMTGTPTKHEYKNEIYKKLNLKILYDLSINDAVDIGLLSNYNINILNVEMNKEKNIKVVYGNKHFFTSEKNQYEYYNKKVEEAKNNNFLGLKKFTLNRMRIIKNSNSKLKAAKELLSRLDGKILVFCGSISQAEKVCKHTYHSKKNDSDLKLFQNDEINKIAMVNSGGIGFTYKRLDHLILIQCDSDRNRITSQKICRILLKQKDYKANIWIICLKDTQDEKWVNSTLQNFDQSKIKYVNYGNK